MDYFKDVLTFQEWIDLIEELNPDPDPYLLEEGYAHYIASILGQTPSKAELKRIGNIHMLMCETEWELKAKEAKEV